MIYFLYVHVAENDTKQITQIMDCVVSVKYFYLYHTTSPTVHCERKSVLYTLAVEEPAAHVLKLLDVMCLESVLIRPPFQTKRPVKTHRMR